MYLRHDALAGAAKMIGFVEAIGRHCAPYGRATVGMIEARPNSRNTVPGECFFTVGFRHPDATVLAARRRAREGSPAEPLQTSMTGTRCHDAPAPSWIATPRIKRRAMSAVCSAPRSVGEWAAR
jgi:N-carbamoyl-L-amino-acid hydrolase